jgi:hypothetical protein
MRKTSEMLSLECKISGTDRIAYSKDLAEHLSNKRSAELSLKSVSTQYRAEIAEYDSKIDGIAEKLVSGLEIKEVNCKISYNFKKKTKRWIRLDTHKTVKVEEISKGEYQEDMKLKDNVPTKGDTKPPKRYGKAAKKVVKKSVKQIKADSKKVTKEKADKTDIPGK